MAPGDMSVATFLARANNIMRLGPLAAATPEASQLKNEVIATAKRYKARIAAQRSAGRPTTSCPPATGSPPQIGRASWRESVCQYVKISVGAVPLKQKKPRQQHHQQTDK